jgi:heptaprenyl diphosphate synthase
MLLIKSIKKPSFSVVGVSICGAICHNIGQILAAIFLLDELRIGFYLPVLIAVGALTGTLIGLVALPIIKHPIFKKFNA